MGITIENNIPVKSPVINDAAPNIPAVAIYSESTILK